MRKILLVKMAILAACLSVRASGPSVAITTTFPKSGDTAVTCKATPTGSFTATPEFDPDDKDEIIINGPQFHWMISPVENVSFSPTDAATVDVNLADNAFGKSYDVSVIVTWIVWDKAVLDFRIITATDTMTLVAFNINLKSVDFKGSGNHLIGKQDAFEWEDDLFGDDGTVPITYAEWQAEDQSCLETRDPVCYSKGSLPEMSAVIDVTPAVSSVVSSKLRVMNGSNRVLEKNINLSDTDPINALSWEPSAALPATLANRVYTLKWQISLDGGGTYTDVGTSINRFFVVYDHPKTPTSLGQLNIPTCRRLNTVLTVTGETADIDLLAKRIQEWRDDQAGIDNSGNIPAGGNTGAIYWALLDGTQKGQCAEGAILMEQAVKLLGIPAEYQHVLASTGLPVRVNSKTEGWKGSLIRNHCDRNETLLLYFSVSTNSPFFAGNTGEGCCLVNEKLYSAFARGVVGVASDNVNGTIALSPAHSILLQLESKHDNIQRWMWSQFVMCPVDWYVPVPKN